MLYPDRNLFVLTAGCLVLGIILGVLLGGAIAPPSETEPWLQSYQGLVGGMIGATGTLLGLYVATRNVRKQMQFNLISREEDRMERVLPGLRDAERWLITLVVDLEMEGDLNIHPILNDLGMIDANQIDSVVAEKLPRTDEITRQRISHALHALYQSAAWAKRLSELGDRARDWLATNAVSGPNEHHVRRHLQMIQNETRAFDARAKSMASIPILHHSIGKRIKEIEESLPRFRKAIERYFAQAP